MKTKKWLWVALLIQFSDGCTLAGGGRVGFTDLLDKIQPGVTTAQQVSELLGPPARKRHFRVRELDFLEYEYEVRDFGDRLIISISIDSSGVVREVARLRQYDS